MNKQPDSSQLNIIESDEKIEFGNRYEKVINKIQISRNDVTNDSKDVRSIEKNTPRRSSRLVKGNVRRERERERKPTIDNEIKNEKGNSNVDIKEKKVVNLTDNRKRIINGKLLFGHVNSNENEKKSSGHLTNTDKSISINSELNDSKIIGIEDQEGNESKFEKDKEKEKEIVNKNGSQNHIIKNSIDSNSDCEKDRSGDWWRDEVEIADQAPSSPPPLHRSSPSCLNSSTSPSTLPLFSTPLTQTVVRNKRTSSLSMNGGESFNSYATTASLTPVINRIPRTQEDFIIDREGREKTNQNKSESVDNAIVKKNGVSELSDVNDKRKKSTVRSRDEEEQEEQEEGEGDERKVRFQSADRSTSIIQNEKDDDDFSNYFVSTFSSSSSVNSSDNEKS